MSNIIEIYSIRRKSDGKYFVSTNGLGTPYFNPSPVFLRTRAGIDSNLRRLCSEFVPKISERWGFMYKDWENFDPAIMEAYDVVIWTVDVLHHRIVPAIEFASVENVADAKLHSDCSNLGE